MNVQELLKLAGVLASKYKDSQEREDLIQEGLLAALDHEDQSFWAVRGRMRKAMSNYKNIFVATQVSVPYGNLTKKLLQKSSEGTAMLGWEKATVQALQGLTEATGDTQELSVGSYEEVYMDEDQIQAIITAAEAFLDEDESAIVKKVLISNHSHASVATQMNIDRSTVKRKIDSAVIKLSNILGG